MRNVAMFLMTVVFGIAGVSAESHTWTGQLSDNMCGAKHMSMGDKKMTDRECTEMCVKAPNAKYVFASQGKVYQIANQKDAALALHAGHTVQLTGEIKGETITVAKIEMPKTEKK